MLLAPPAIPGPRVLPEPQVVLGLPVRLGLPAQKGLLERLEPLAQPGLPARLAPLAHRLLRQRPTRAGNSQHMVGGRGWRREAAALAGSGTVTA